MDSIRFRNDVRQGDDEVVREIITSTGFFYDIEIPVAVELIQEKLREGEKSTYQFLFAEIGDRPVAYACFGQIAGTEHSYDLYWIATHLDYRGKGIGKELLKETYRIISRQGGKNVIAETSSLEKFLPTRKFYEQQGYIKCGLIPDFYKDGDGKVTYVIRLLNGPETELPSG
ncbi:MAG: GNAT family N-acetyltransferase [bacterium]